MTEKELQQLLQRLLVGWEGECVEFKEANDNFSTSDIGTYFSALSNEANLRGLPSAWLVFGVNNKTRAITGTDYRQQRDRLHSLKQQIAQGADPTISFREIHEFTAAEGRVLLFEIPAAPRGIPIAWNGHFFARNGESLAALTLAKQDEIRAQSLADDWSAIVCKEATVAHLDPEALAKARELFLQKHGERIPATVIRSWDDATFLDKARLSSNGRITRATLLLLGRPQSTVFLSPYVAEMSWKLEGPELAYEHFHPPFLLTTSQLFQRIRNLRLSFLPANQLIPVDVSKYDQRIVLEALHNCIAHQDYTRCERILVIERQGELVFQNAGSFFDGTPREYVLNNRTPSRYRNRFLAEAMVQLRMIDTMGFGIREIMFRGQANRYLPMPDYDTTGPEHVIMRLQGRFLDENYSRTLLTHADLSWPELLALDTIQKGLATDEETVDSLRRQGFIEGRRPHLHVASHIAAATETEAEYIKHRAFDDRYFCDLILDYLKTFGQGQRTDFERLLTGKLSDLLNDKQKAYKVGRLLQKLRREGKVRVEGQTRAGIWRLSQP
jgi:ATP-dependent DNA helicase RecG